MSKQEKNSTKTLKKTVRKNFTENLASGLLAFSQMNSEFAEYLSVRLKTFSGGKEVIKAEENDKLFVPENIEIAKKRLEWMTRIAIKEPKSEHAQALHRLSASVQKLPFETPRQVVIGIVGLAWPGPTLGVITTKKKMSVYIKQGLDRETQTKVAVKVSHKALNHALVMAGGNLKELEPEMSDWFWGDKNIQIKTLEHKQISKIKKSLKKIEVPNGVEEIDGEVVAVAVSPIVDDLDDLI